MKCNEQDWSGNVKFLWSQGLGGWCTYQIKKKGFKVDGEGLDNGHLIIIKKPRICCNWSNVNIILCEGVTNPNPVVNVISWVSGT